MLHSLTLVEASAASALLCLAHYANAYRTTDLALFAALGLGLAAAWFDEGRSRESGPASCAAELSLAAVFGLIRRQLLLATAFWTYEYDVWVGLTVALCLTGIKQV